MLLRNPATFAPFRGPMIVALSITWGAGAVVILTEYLTLGKSSLESFLVLLTLLAAAFASPSVALMSTSVRQIETPEWIEILPSGFIGLLRPGPLQYVRLEVAFQGIKEFVPANAMTNSRPMFRFPHLLADGHKSVDLRKPLSSNPATYFQGPTRPMRISITEVNLARIRDTWNAWALSQRIEDSPVGHPRDSSGGLDQSDSSAPHM
jgi:hypothetical protein